MRGPDRLHSCAPQSGKRSRACVKSVKNVARGEFHEILDKVSKLQWNEPVAGTFATVLDGLSSIQELVLPLPYQHLRLPLHRLTILRQ